MPQARPVEFDPLLYNAMQATGSPARLSYPPPGERQEGSTTVGEPQMPWWDRLAELAQFAGNALPFRGGFGDIPLGLFKRRGVDINVADLPDTSRSVWTKPRAEGREVLAGLTGKDPTLGILLRDTQSRALYPDDVYVAMLEGLLEHATGRGKGPGLKESTAIMDSFKDMLREAKVKGVQFMPAATEKLAYGRQEKPRLKLFSKMWGGGQPEELRGSKVPGRWRIPVE